MNRVKKSVEHQNFAQHFNVNINVKKGNETANSPAGASK